MSADTLHAAATRLRTLAEAATPGPWHPATSGVASGDHWSIIEYPAMESVAFIPSNDGENESQREPDARYIAAMSPPVALAVADLLDAEANRTNTCRPCDRPDCEASDCRAIRAALAVAEAIGGGA